MAIGRSACTHPSTTIARLAFCGLVTWAGSAEATPPSIWYRASEGCPEGPAFLERLEHRGVQARLAEVGDRIDFVVTLGASGELSSGRLERQTSDGIIAIRQVEDVSCAAVADALALTLALTHDPDAQGAPAVGGAAPAGPPVAVEAAAPPENEAAPASAAGTPDETPAVAAAPAEASSARSPAADEVTLAVGVAALAADVFEGPWLLSLGPFVQLEEPASFALPRATLRAALSGGFRFDAGEAARLWLAVARFEGCPVGLALGPAVLHPCLALDTGAVGASAAGRADVGWWFSLAAHARVAVELGRLGLEAQAGGIVPVTQYAVTSATSAMTLEKTRSIGFAAGFGASYRFE